MREPDVDWAMLVPQQGTGLQRSLKLVTSEAGNHRRHHLDPFASDQAAAVERPLGQGAGPGADDSVLADPDGNRFCVAQR